MTKLETEIKTKFIIVDSVKGGCGKTTDALAVAIDRAGKDCIDLLGTSMERLIMGGLFIRETKRLMDQAVYKRANRYLNDLVSIENAFFHDYATGIEIGLGVEGSCDIDFIISSPYECDRRKFRVSGNSNYTMQITPTHFRGVIKKLIERLMDEKYKTIVFDMPPNSDVYTDCVFDILLNTEYRQFQKNKIDSVELRIVSTVDRSHIYSNIDWLSDIYHGRDHHWAAFDKISFVVNNNNIPSIFNGDSHKLDIFKNSIKTAALKVLAASKYKKMIEFLYRGYDNKLVNYFLFQSDGIPGRALNFDTVGTAWINAKEF